jgi:serine/threonine protein phosphatase PrpC
MEVPDRFARHARHRFAPRASAFDVPCASAFDVPLARRAAAHRRRRGVQDDDRAGQAAVARLAPLEWREHVNYVLAREHRIGMRKCNQDYAGHDVTDEAMLLTVADGMGGYFGGELAAEIAVGSLSHSFSGEAKPKLADPGEFLERAIARAHVVIRRYASAQTLPEVPRTVIVACVVQDGCAWWNHVGDSRLYLVRDGRIEARTRDHTYVQELVDAGRIAEEAMATHSQSNRVLQSLGGPITPEPGPGWSARLQKDDILLLCSDGFWGPLRPSQLLQGLIGRSIEQSIAELSDLAERRAGSHADNLTVLAVHWNEEAVALADAPRTRTDREQPADAAGFAATGVDVPQQSDAKIGQATGEARDASRRGKREIG